jgi:gamma-glutamylaminecyclotransferase
MRATRVFVYGSLLAGEPNHRVLERPRLLAADVRTEASYSLHDLGAYPAMVPDGEDSIVGELYEVDAATLAALDRLEGHPRFYKRTEVALIDGTTAETYLLPRTQVTGRPVVRGGSWRARRKEKGR